MYSKERKTKSTDSFSKKNTSSLKVENKNPTYLKELAIAKKVTQLNKDDDKEPFVELKTGVKEKKTRVKTGLLGNALKNDDLVRENKSEKNRPPSREAQYLFHATTYKNLITILSKGLDPNKGGTDVGASALAEGKLKDDSLKGSKGFVHGASQSEVALHYANKFDKKEKEKEAKEIAGFSVMLRFKTGGKQGWTEDTEDSRGNYKTQNVITPDKIEYLEAGSGWQPLTNIKLADLKDLVYGTSEQHETLEKVKLTKPVETKGIAFENLTTVDLSSMGSKIRSSEIEVLVAAIEKGELPNLKLLTLDVNQIDTGQRKRITDLKKVTLKIVGE